jgi:hypothetical protein
LGDEKAEKLQRRNFMAIRAVCKQWWRWLAGGKISATGGSLQSVPKNFHPRGANTGPERDSPSDPSFFSARRFSTQCSIDTSSGACPRATAPARHGEACGVAKRAPTIAGSPQGWIETPKQPNSRLERASTHDLVLGRYQGRPRRKTRYANDQELHCRKDRAISCLLPPPEH